MLKVVHELLDRLAERCLAVTGGMLSTALESLHVAYLAEEQRRLEDLARSLETDGLPEIAVSVRERAKALSNENAAARTSLLQFAAPSPSAAENAADRNCFSPGLDMTAARRVRGRAKRPAAADVAPPLSAPSSDANDVFFPIHSASSPRPNEDSQA
jgi:hypothetical protein